MGITLMCVAIFGVGIIVGYMPANIDFSPDSFTVTGDEVADRHRAVDAAEQRSTSLSPMRLSQQLSESPPPSPPSAPSPFAPPTPQLPSPPFVPGGYGPGEGETLYNFEEQTYLSLYLKLDESSELVDGLFDVAAATRIKALQDSLFKLPQLASLCEVDSEFGPINGTRPNGNCTMPHGVVRLMYSDQSTMARFQGLNAPIPPLIVPSVSAALPLALAASRIGGASGRLNTSNVLRHLRAVGITLGGMGVPASMIERLEQPSFTCGTFGLVGNGLSATDCGPVADCCACGDDSASSGCARLPLCRTSTDSTALEYRMPFGNNEIDSSEAPLTGAAIAAEVATEISCEGSALREAIGWATPLAYRTRAHTLPALAPACISSSHCGVCAVRVLQVS